MKAALAEYFPSPMIIAPRTAAENYDRDLECELAVEENLRELAVLAEVAGWRRREVAWTLLRLATACYAGALKSNGEPFAPDAIAAPRSEADYRNRESDCEAALRPALLGLIAKAVQTGWTGRETAFTLVRLCGRLVSEASQKPKAVTAFG